MKNDIGMMADTVFSEDGEGPTVILVHGLGLNQDMWQWQLDALQKHYRVVRYDLLGHGGSEKPSGPYSMEQMVDQLYRLITTQGYGQCALVGFSLGGLIVQAFALAHPDLVSALAILNAAHARTDEQRAGIMKRVEQCRESGPGATVTDALTRWFTEDYADKNPEVLAQVRQWVIANNPKVYPELYRLLAMADIGLEDNIANIQCPVLILTGEEDFGNSVEMAQCMASLIPSSQLEILKGLRHMALAESPVQVNKLLINFLEDALSLAEK
ncbi:alpha/beta fold hydrolase [Dasania marina]|uniref:alpha/beta fold hydrolase n=1 Tax=Dasania marina TaxID=471499 RepID=UPI0030DB877E|tara:strand:- start:44999 stop:45808 length:810 start_codon:yes stop_codon:yes gene_type:complete